MQFVVLDFETFFDSKTYTLKKMTTEAYLRDPRFEVHGCGVKWPAARMKRAEWYKGPSPLGLSMVDWNDTAIICHHAHFDAGILAFHYGIRPRMIIDTLSMARAIVGNHIKVNLGSLAEHYGLAAKNVPYNLFDGRRWHELTESVQHHIAAGCCHDVDLTWDIFNRLAAEFPAEEYAMVDSTVRMFTEPVLVGNTNKLAEIWEGEERDRRELLDQLRVSGSDIRSNEVFANLLRAEGVEPETKPGKRGENYAFAKTDQFMRDLLEDGEPRVQALVSARLAEKSNIVQTRSARLHAMSQRGAMCVYLAPCGAHTTRWSGGDKLNWQNFPRESELGKAIEAPTGSSLVIVDASQIECRLLNYIAGQWDVIERFARKEDVYCNVASQFYGYPVNKNDHPVERQNGKIWELMGGYGAGPRRYGQQTRIATGGKVVLSSEDEQGACDAYRSTHPAVVALWQAAGDVLKNINNGFDFDWLVFKIRNKRMYLPNGLFLNYESLHWFDGDDADDNRGWRLQTRKGSVRMYGAKLVENFIQALSACHIRLVWGRLLPGGVKVASMEHDKLILCVPEEAAEDVLIFTQERMREPPPWAPGIPLDSEGYVSRTFKREK